MDQTLRVLFNFPELHRMELETLCQNNRAFTESVKMVAAADMTNFKATEEAGHLNISAVCHASQKQHSWYKARVVLRQVRNMEGSEVLAVSTSACACKLGYPGFSSGLGRIRQSFAGTNVVFWRHQLRFVMSTSPAYFKRIGVKRFAEFSKEPNFWPSIWNAEHLRIKSWPETRSVILSPVRNRATESRTPLR